MHSEKIQENDVKYDSTVGFNMALLVALTFI